MKRLEIKKIIESIIKEIGDLSAKSYQYTATTIRNRHKEYHFTTDSGLDYNVELYLGQSGYLVVDFSVGEDYDFSVITNKGELYKIMSTIANIIKNEIKLNNKIIGVVYQPSEDKVKSGYDKKRDKLYRIFLNKQFPNSKIKTDGSQVRFTF